MVPIKVINFLIIVYLVNFVYGTRNESQGINTTLEERVDQLIELSLRSVIRLNSDKFRQYVGAKSLPRNYSFVVMFTDLSPHRQCSVCRLAMEEYTIVANSWRYSPSFSNRLFFGMVDMGEGADIFKQLAIDSTPVFLYFSEKGLINSTGPMEMKRRGFTAETIADWVSDLSSLTIEIIAPPRSKANRQYRPRRDKKKCTRAEKSELISKLIGLFAEEYERYLYSRQEDANTILRYKFSTLDVDKDERITRHEFKDFRESVKQRLILSNCAMSFFKSIDTNSDRLLTLNEWIAFFTQRWEKPNQRSERFESSKFNTSATDLWPTLNASVHGLTLLNSETAEEKQSSKEKEDELDHIVPKGFNVDSIILRPNVSETRQMMIDRLKKMIDINKLLSGGA